MEFSALSLLAPQVSPPLGQPPAPLEESKLVFSPRQGPRPALSMLAQLGPQASRLALLVPRQVLPSVPRV